MQQLHIQIMQVLRQVRTGVRVSSAGARQPAATNYPHTRLQPKVTDKLCPDKQLNENRTAHFTTLHYTIHMHLVAFMLAWYSLLI